MEKRKYLEFSSGDDRFPHLYNLFVLGHLMTAQGARDAAKRDLPKARLDARLLRDLKAISEPNPDDRTSTGEAHRRCAGGRLSMTVDVWERACDVAKLAVPALPDEVLVESVDALDLLLAAPDDGGAS